MNTPTQKLSGKCCGEMIQINRKVLIFESWIKTGLVHIKDIVYRNGEITENLILAKLQNKTNWIREFSQIKAAIPREWK